MRRHFILSGRVQGVGFRWRASQIGEMLGLTGWVRNLEDGSVEMEAEGTRQISTGCSKCSRTTGISTSPGCGPGRCRKKAGTGLKYGRTNKQKDRHPCLSFACRKSLI